LKKSPFFLGQIGGGGHLGPHGSGLAALRPNWGKKIRTKSYKKSLLQKAEWLLQHNIHYIMNSAQTNKFSLYNFAYNFFFSFL